MINLVIPRDEAEAKLEDRIEKGKEILSWSITSETELHQGQHEFNTWSEYNARLLERIFSDDSEANNYRGSVSPAVGLPLDEQIALFQRRVSGRIQKLEAYLEQLEIIPVADNVHTLVGPAVGGAATSSKRVFIVHGHDEAVKQAVARFLTRLDLDPIVLEEQTSAGMTLAEKFEHHSDVRYAVILLSPDDLGATEYSVEEAKSTGNDNAEKLRGVVGALEPRARQNVVFELGFFYGKLGRRNACVLLVGGVEKPSDMDGIVYVDFDKSGGWRMKLAQEMKEAGLTVDMNKAL